MIFAHSDSPLKVTLLLFPGLSLLSLAATLDPMRGANRVLGRAAYSWKLVSIDGKMPVASCGLPIPVDVGEAGGEILQILPMRRGAAPVEQPSQTHQPGTGFDAPDNG